MASLVDCVHIINPIPAANTQLVPLAPVGAAGLRRTTLKSFEGGLVVYAHTRLVGNVTVNQRHGQERGHEETCVRAGFHYVMVSAKTTGLHVAQCPTVYMPATAAGAAASGARGANETCIRSWNSQKRTGLQVPAHPISSSAPDVACKQRLRGESGRGQRCRTGKRSHACMSVGHMHACGNAVGTLCLSGCR